MHIKSLSIAIFCLSCLALTIAHAEDVTVDSEGKPCEEMVDLSETAQFHRLHFECAEKKEKREMDEAKPQPQLAAQRSPQVVVKASALSAQETLTARATFDMTDAASLSNAQHDVFRQMAQSCLQGWTKLVESVAPNSQPKSYQLSIQYQCLGH